MGAEEFVTVETSSGAVKGVQKLSTLGRNYFQFHGIPYMKPPVGKLRFRDAEEPEISSELIDATGPRPSYITMNRFMLEIEGQESAGTVSVATPYLDRKLPVAVYIHGGGFQHAYGMIDAFGPDYLLQKDLVFVTMNYRVGPFGFLSFEDPELGIPGNAGLKDQVMALKWIQKNIERFGGDPGNVTIFGTSAGSVSCHFLMLSETTKGLFHRVIAMSGTTHIRTWPFTSKKSLTHRLARALGWDGSGGDGKILEILENADAGEIVKIESTLLTAEEIFNEHILFPFTPVIEPYETPNSIMTKDPTLLVQNSWSNDIDCIFGMTSLEGGLMALYKEFINFGDIFASPNCLFPPQMALPLKNINPQNIERSGRKLQDFYFKNESPSAGDRYQYLLYAGDIHFGFGIYQTIMSRINSGGKGRSFLYRFDACSHLNALKNLIGLQLPGACHGDDFGYIFKPDVPRGLMDAPKVDSDEFEIVKTLTTLMSSFIIKGDPNCFQSGVEFKPILAGDDELKCLNITNTKFEMTKVPELDRFKFWDEIMHDIRDNSETIAKL